MYPLVTISPQDIVLIAIVGVIAGFLANAMMGGRGHLLKYLVLGVIGAFVGGYLQSALNLPFDLGSEVINKIVVATAGAVIVAFLARLIG